MPAIKVTMFFAVDKYTWTETHMWLTTSATPSLQSALGPANQLSALRVQLLGNLATMWKLRLASVPSNRQFLDIYPPFISTTPTWPADPTGLQYSASRPFESVQELMGDGAGATKNFYIAGVPTGEIHSSAADRLGLAWATGGDFASRLAAYNTFLVNGQWGWATRRDSVLQQVQAPIVTNAAFPNMVGVQVPAQIVPPPAPAPFLLLLKNWRRINTKSPKLGGIWQVGGVLPPVAPSTLWTYFLFNSGLVSPTNFKAMGQAGLLFIDFRTYVTANPVQATKRGRGGSAGAPRGRVRSRF